MFGGKHFQTDLKQEMALSAEFALIKKKLAQSHFNFSPDMHE